MVRLIQEMLERELKDKRSQLERNGKRVARLKQEIELFETDEEGLALDIQILEKAIKKERGD